MKNVAVISSNITWLRINLSMLTCSQRCGHVIVMLFYSHTCFIQQIIDLKRGVWIDHCHKKEGNKVEIMHLPALHNLSS